MSKIKSTEIDESTLKATGAEVTTGTLDTKLVTPKAIADSTVMKSPASAVDSHIPLFNSTSGKLLKSGGYGIRFGTAVVTTNASGDASISYSTAFGTGTTAVIVSSGDYQVGNLIVAINGTPSASAFSIRVLNTAGAAHVGGFRCNYVAFGV